MNEKEKYGQSFRTSQSHAVATVIRSGEFTDAELMILKWQFDALMGLLGHFWKAMFEAIPRADDHNLSRLRRAFPDEVNAFLDWRHGTLAERLSAAMAKAGGVL